MPGESYNEPSAASSSASSNANSADDETIALVSSDFEILNLREAISIVENLPKLEVNKIELNKCNVDF